MTDAQPMGGEIRCFVCKGELPDDETRIVSVGNRLACEGCVDDEPVDDPCFDRDLDLED